VLLNMVASADGRATLAGRSGGLSSPADRELFHALRLASDAVMVGAGTVRQERYGRIVRDPAARRTRAEHGLADEPLACIVSASLQLDPSIPLLASPEARVAILTASDGELEGAAAQITYIRKGRAGTCDLATALHELQAGFGVRLVLCEGGPHLGAELLARGLLDELFLSVSPTLLGGDPPARPALRILAGPELEPPAELALLAAATADSHLFLRYAVVAPERVSRETTSSSSLAR
jgi:riboflavin biosynthesis pyrimidine reductase